MPQIEIRKAQRVKSKLRLAIAGPSGSGKTYSSLKLAHGIAPKGRVLMIDTERGSGDLYANLFEYDIITLTPPYKPSIYIDALNAGVSAGYDVVILDSLSHAWSDDGGLLDQADKMQAAGKNRFTMWADLTPQHRQLVNGMLNSPVHIIATMRSKQDYVMEEEVSNNGGKRMTVKKMGLAPVQREGMEYEFTVFMDVDMSHHAKASKDRTDLFKDEIFTIDEKIGDRILNWLNEGINDPKVALQEKKSKIWGLMKDLGLQPKTAEEARGLIMGALGLELIEGNYDPIIEKLKAKRDARLQEVTAEKNKLSPGGGGGTGMDKVVAQATIVLPNSAESGDGSNTGPAKPLPMGEEALGFKQALESSKNDLELDEQWKKVEGSQTLSGFERGQLRNVHAMTMEKIKTEFLK